MRKTGSKLLVLVALVMLAACGGPAATPTTMPATTVPATVMAGGDSNCGDGRGNPDGCDGG